MLKPTLLVSLFGLSLYVTNATYAAPSPVPLLVEQCLRLPSIDLATVFANARLTASELTLAQRALIFEQQMLGLNNINDRLNYYRGFNLPSEEREGLLQCQLHLADTLSQLLSQTELSQLAYALAQGNAEQILLSQQLKQLLQQHWSAEEKAKLHTAQASIGQGLGSQQFSLAFNDSQCQPEVTQQHHLHTKEDKSDEPKPDSSKESDFSGTIVSYLLTQENTVCRQNVWQAYQARASETNQTALERIAEQRQQAATTAGFTDYSALALSSQHLSSPELVKAFLDSQTQDLQVAPWDIGRTLSQQASAKGPTWQTSDVLSRSFTFLQVFGLQFETIATANAEKTPTVPNRPHIIRAYHQQRLLGEIYVAYNQNPQQGSQQQTLRQSVLGQQFGQQALDLKPQLSNYKDIEQLTESIAEAVTSLAKASHFYLNNAMGQSQDSYFVASLWLAEVLRHQLFPQFEHTYLQERETLAKAYSKQLKVFRAKVAVNFYQNSSAQVYPDLGAEFNASFGQDWPQTQDYPYSFNAIANEGPLYYQSLWQASLAQLIAQSTFNCQDKLKLFNVLVINEDALSFSDQLKAVIGAPVDSAALIQRISNSTASEHADSSNNQAFDAIGSCAF
ncbi:MULTISPECIES: M3 family metallopeptidase [unclassified Shewanella]|uniref:M3 family metallopeptidase n=1 Tax=unclassified Shewanella TaxID=196818 RepID=UPI0021DA4B1A|nr:MULTISPECIES: M3 family metallopeptidase [unclassified Shewanella]MCU8003099.1 M3 family metallopeptidase [Shewanella sp. SM96]MCU8060901.1 M3 family metallopeptidase [Shewanella sp. SM55]